MASFTNCGNVIMKSKLLAVSANDESEGIPVDRHIKDIKTLSDFIPK